MDFGVSRSVVVEENLLPYKTLLRNLRVRPTGMDLWSGPARVRVHPLRRVIMSPLVLGVVEGIAISARFECRRRGSVAVAVAVLGVRLYRSIGWNDWRR